MRCTSVSARGLLLGALLWTGLSPQLNAAPNDGDQQRVAREMIQVLEAYAVYKMGEFEQAFERYQALAEAGNHQGMLNLGNMYAAGLGTEVDLRKAWHWYRQAAESGDAIGMYEVARALDNGLGTAVDKQAARAWYIRAAEADNSEAQWQLGQQLYAQGHTSEGLHWIRTAAQAGGLETARQFIQALEGNGTARAPSAAEQAAVQQLFSATTNAANTRNASAMVMAVADDALIHIRLPHSSSWQKLQRSELQTLWQQTFDQARDYRYQRGASQLLHSGADILAFTVIEEQLQGAEQQRLELHESATLRIKDGAAQIHRLRLDIRQLDY